MNLILDAFERVFYPNNLNAKRRASSSGLATTLTGPITPSFSSSSRRTTTTTMNSTSNTTTNSLTTECYQQLDSSKQNRRRQSSGGGAINSGFQNEFVALSIEEPTIKVCNEPSMRIQRQQSGTSRSRSSNAGGGSKRQRKKSNATSGSMASLIFSALSSPNDNRMRRKKPNNNNGNRMSGRRRQLPPRQWSVPEKDGSDVNTTQERDNVTAEPFRLIQKAYSLCCEDSPQLPSSSRSSLIGSPHSPLSISSHNCFNSGATILFGFITTTTSSASLHDCWERLALESSRLDSEVYFLRCIDPKPKLPFIYYASVTPDLLEQSDLNNLTETIMNEEFDSSTKIQLGCYEELYTLERATDKKQSNKSAHQGFILIFFRLLGEDTYNSSSDLESRWLNWSGAGQIYKYSPRCWELQKVCLLRHLQHSSPRNISSIPSMLSTFAYVLLCEFNEILHPSNALSALDLCEKLRIRNCGLVALYKVTQSCINKSQYQKQQYRQQLLSDQQPKETNLSPNWPLSQQYRKHQLGRMGRSHDERVSIGARREKNSPPSPRPSCGENSQQYLNNNGGTDKLRRLIWAREQQHSLGWEQQPQQQWFGQPTKNGTIL